MTPTDRPFASRTGTQSRGAERVKVEGFVKVATGDAEYVFRTRDLSKTGLFIFTKVAHIYPFGVGSRLWVEVYDYDRAVSCKVVVVRVVEPGSAEAEAYPFGFGCHIVEIDEQNRSRLEDMIDRVARTREPLY